MSSEIPGELPDHPARAASIRSMAAVEAKDKDTWVGGFTEDGHIEDPVGVSPLDPSGEGHRGRDAIAAFWDGTIAPNTVEFAIERSYAAGDECANVGSITTTLPDGTRVRTEGVFVYRIDDAGALTSLRAFWEFDRMTIVDG